MAKAASSTVSDLSCIEEGLYLGSLNAATQTNNLKELGITHILTLDCRPLSKVYQLKNASYKYVRVLDSEETDLLCHFNECFQFMNDAKQSGGAVLVHCYAGQSRSGTIMIAYLMNSYNINLDESFNKVQQQRESIKPNAGFMNQLELFEAMGNKIDKNHSGYKMYRLRQWAQAMTEARQEYELSEDMMAADPNELKDSAETIYKCGKCRRPLFRASSLLEHNEGEGEAAFDWRVRLLKQRSEGSNTISCTESLFLEPVQWMSETIVVTEGKLSCPKCHGKLGTFNWAGERCPCGTWVTPAFHIHSGKVDLCVPQQNRFRVTRHHLPVMNSSTGLPVGEQIFL